MAGRLLQTLTNYVFVKNLVLTNSVEKVFVSRYKIKNIDVSRYEVYFQTTKLLK